MLVQQGDQVSGKKDGVVANGDLAIKALLACTRVRVHIVSFSNQEMQSPLYSGHS